MRLVLGILGAAIAFPAFAADMPLKAPPLTGYPYAASGFYWGVGASAVAQSATIANTGVFSAGAGLDGVIGYQWKGGLEFIALEAIFTYNNIGNSTACAMPTGAATSCALGSQFEIDPRVKFGFPLATLQALLPNLSGFFPALPTLPATFVPANQHPYIFVGVPVKDVSANFGLANGKEWLVQGEVGAGILNQWTNGTAVDISAGCSLGNTGFEIGPASTNKASMGVGCTSRIAVLY